MTDLRAVVGVTGVAMQVYVGFLVNDLGELALRSDTWPYLIPLGFAAALGWGQHCIIGQDRLAVVGRVPYVG